MCFWPERRGAWRRRWRGWCRWTRAPAAFPAGKVLRAPVNHMSAIVLRRTEGVELWVFRSMARTLWHELTDVLDHLEARAG